MVQFFQICNLLCIPRQQRDTYLWNDYVQLKSNGRCFKLILQQILNTSNGSSGDVTILILCIWEDLWIERLVN